MPPRRPAPSFQLRVIGPGDHARRILDHLAEHVTPLFGPLVTCRTQVCSARRRDYVRAYFTVTPKEEI